MHKSRNRRFHFNMFEIVLAIAILAFGFASVLGLFPVGIKAVRNSQAEGLVSNAVNNIYVYYKSFAHATKSSGGCWYNDLFDGSGIIDWGESTADKSRTKVKDTNVNNLLYGNNFLEKLKICDDPIDLTDSESKKLGFQPGLDLFQPEGKTLVYFLVLGSPDFKKTEFTAQIIVWKKQVNKLIPYSPPTPPPPFVLLDYKKAVELNMEVSWPVNIPYTDREKRHYQFIITNPDQTP